MLARIGGAALQYCKAVPDRDLSALLQKCTAGIRPAITLLEDAAEKTFVAAGTGSIPGLFLFFSPCFVFSLLS